MDVQVCYITHTSEDAALDLCRQLLARKLIACANIFQIRSLYLWEGQPEEGAEWISIVKTSRAAEEALRAAVEELHPYEVPCMLSWSARANEAYASWVHGSVLLG
jgi:periplasmic divalent cation tolerance protein